MGWAGNRWSMVNPILSATNKVGGEHYPHGSWSTGPETSRATKPATTKETMHNYGEARNRLDQVDGVKVALNPQGKLMASACAM